jgi:hypothetical protein
MTIDVYRSSSDDFSFNSEIIEAATEGLAVPAAYHHQSGHYLIKIQDKGLRAICFLTVSYGAWRAVSTCGTHSDCASFLNPAPGNHQGMCTTAGHVSENILERAKNLIGRTEGKKVEYPTSKRTCDDCTNSFLSDRHIWVTPRRNIHAICDGKDHFPCHTRAFISVVSSY